MIVDDLLFLCFYCIIYEMKPDIFEIFRTFSRYLEKKSGISGNIFRRSLIFCPKLALGRLFPKIIFKSSNDFVYLGNLGKIKSAVKMRSKCGFLVDQKVR